MCNDSRLKSRQWRQLPALLLLALYTAQAATLQVANVTDTLFLPATQISARLWVTVNDIELVSSALAEIWPPLPATESVALPLNCSSAAARCEATASGVFTVPGRYDVFYFLWDKNTGSRIPMEYSVIYQAKAGNNPPRPFSALVPVDGVGARTQLRFDWQTTRDPDGDPFTYAFLISTQGGAAFDANVVYRQEHLTAPLLYVDGQALIRDGRTDGTVGLRDLTAYYWRVLAVDDYGAITAGGPPRRFLTDNATNGGLIDACAEQHIGCGDGYLGGLTPGSRMVVDAVWAIDRWYRVELVYQGGAGFTLDLGRSGPASQPGEGGATFYYAEGSGRLFVPTARVEGRGQYRAEMFLDNPAAWGFTVTELCSGIESPETTTCFNP